MTTFRLSDHGATFATRQRMDDLAVLLGRGEHITIDFAGVKAASPAFIDELAGLVANAFGEVTIIGAENDIAALIERVIGRRELGLSFRLERK